MTGVEYRRSGMTVAGFAVIGVLLLLATAGLAGGQFAYAFVGITAGALVVGATSQVVDRSSRWRTFGFGVLLGGCAGVLLMAGIVLASWYAFTH